MAEAQQFSAWNHTSAIFYGINLISYLLQLAWHNGKGPKPEEPEPNAIHPLIGTAEREASKLAKETAARMSRELGQMQLVAGRGEEALKKFVEAKAKAEKI